jgi:hypothetical protein
MFALVAAKSRIQEINGFDQSFRRGFDHSGELDFLLRWSMHALHEYGITDKAMLMHPGLPANEQDVEEMKFQSSITRRVFMDRYDEKSIADLKAPYSLELPLVEVNYAHTYPALMEVEESSLDLDAEDVKDLTTFSKRPSSDFIVEVI